MPQLISFVLVIYSYFLIQTNLPKLPRSIPTHFNAVGVADAWGKPETLWLLLAVQALTTIVFLCVPYLGQRFPKTVNLGMRKLSDYSPEQQLRILPVLTNMMGYTSLMANLFFTYLLHEIIQAARQPIPRIHLLLPLVLMLGGTLGVTVYYLGQIRRIAKGADLENQ